MRSIVKRSSSRQLGFVRRLFKLRKKPPFGNPAREYKKIDYDSLRKDMLIVFLNPSKHIEIREKWVNLYPQNMMIRQALKHMVFERRNPKRKAEWEKAPKNILEELVRSSIESQINVVRSENERIKENWAYGKGLLQSIAYTMSRGTRKRTKHKFNQEVKKTKKNVTIITNAINVIARRNKAHSLRIKEIGEVFVGCARAGDANIALTGLRNTFAEQITGRTNANEKLLGAGGFVEFSKLSNLSSNEIKQVADFAAQLAESIVKEEVRRVPLTKDQLSEIFNEQYLRFLALRLQHGKDGVKTKGLLTV